MRRLIICISCLYSVSVCTGQVVDSVMAIPADVNSPEKIVGALYDVISGPAGERRNWVRMRSLFLPEAKLVATGIRPDGSTSRRIMSVEDYIMQAGPNLEKDGFFEKEIGRKIEQFGNIMHVFSTYESRRKAEEAKPFMRGINSIQLWNDGKRWWIVNVLWQSESPQSPIPEKYIGYH
ncbi:MAG TPA: hypothetical protein VFO70_05215 [Chitinophagaceae bacterium]|nr:hypothetical protein [Chitinophagaceae bacterium]HEX5651620.1 hypothetical protein [Chitinophagaceae bacterium]